MIKRSISINEIKKVRLKGAMGIKITITGGSMGCCFKTSEFVTFAYQTYLLINKVKANRTKNGRDLTFYLTLPKF